MKERQKEKKQIAKGKGSTSISRRHATGNAHQCQPKETERKVPNSEREEKNKKKKRQMQTEKKKLQICGHQFVNAVYCLLFVVKY